jgi:hypothetical protein
MYGDLQATGEVNSNSSSLISDFIVVMVGNTEQICACGMFTGDTAAHSFMAAHPLVELVSTASDHGSFAILRNCSPLYRPMAPEPVPKSLIPAR